MINHNKTEEQVFPLNHKKNLNTLSKKKNNSAVSLIQRVYHPLDDRNFFIQKDNELLTSKIKKIAVRQNQLLKPNLGVEAYKKEKQKSLKSLRYLYKKALDESNNFFKNKLTKSKSFINNKKIKEDYLFTRKVYKNLRKIYPNNCLDVNLSNVIHVNKNQKYISIEELMNNSNKFFRNKSKLPLIKVLP